MLLDRSKVTIHKTTIKDREVTGEIRRLQAAIDMSVAQLDALKRQIKDTRHEEHAKILEAHQLMLQDDLLVKGTEELIAGEKINVEWALQRSLGSIKEFFENLEDEFFRERQTDVEIVGDRILRNLTGQHSESLMELVTRVQAPSILIAQSLTPADALQLRAGHLIGICTEEGTKTTHTAIVARSMELPAVLGARTVAAVTRSGDKVVIDGDSGEVCVRPTKRQMEAFQKRHRKVSSVRAKLSRRRTNRAVTGDGFEVTLSGNIDLVEEVEALESRGGRGIGLYRTEYLFLNRRDLPTEQEQYLAYKEILKRSAPYPATIRTLDIGGDKLELPRMVGEALNPFFGLRAIRYCLKEQSLFRTQLRALLRASIHGKLRLLIPFITDVTEIRDTRTILEEVKAQLRSEGHNYSKNIELGAMIEIPSAALIADILAREVDFVSVGTNDLIQYTLAIARDSTEIGYLYHPLHPAVLRILGIISDAAHKEGIRLAMCGEMASEPLYSAVLLGFRFHELSMNPRSIPVVREIIQRMRLSDARALVDRVAYLPTYQEVEAAVAEYMNAHFPDLSPLLTVGG